MQVPEDLLEQCMAEFKRKTDGKSMCLKEHRKLLYKIGRKYGIEFTETNGEGK